MRLTSLQENLNKGLGIVGRAVATRTTLPVTQNVYLATDQSRLKLSATNLEIAITTWIGAQVEEEGALTVPARLLSEFVNALPEETVDLFTSGEANTLNLKCARSDARINGTDADDFPPIPSVEEGSKAFLDPHLFRSAIAQVVFAAATEDSRPILTGVKMECEGDRMTLAAADGFRLAVHYGQLVSPASESISVVIPAKTLQEVNRLLNDQTEPVEFIVDPSKGQIMFRFSNIELVSQLIQGAFPNYNQLIPASHTSRAIVNLNEFRRAARTASIFARDGSGIVRIQMEPGNGADGKISVLARADEVGEQQGELDANVEGEESKIAFNGRYLADALSAIDPGQVAIETTGPSSPGVFRPTSNDNYVHVVMPMFVQW
jgi:DNA polymerase-3 subunit beta